MGTVLRPDKEFIQDVLQSGGDSVKKCFQCANCTAVCDLSSGDAPFPRKQMQMAAWGLKDKLAADPSIWFCHQCRDCSAQCPRQAKPADAVSAIRLAVIKHFAKPKFMGKLLSDPSYFPVVFLIPMALIVFMLSLSGSFSFPAGEVNYGAWLKHLPMELTMSALFFMALGSAFVSGRNFWRAIDAANPGDKTKGVDWKTAIIETAKELVFHNRFDKCSENKPFRLWHMGILFGFAGLFFVTSVVVILAILGMYPLSLWHPLKVLGNIAALALLGGCVGAILNRLDAQNSKAENVGAYQDWLFLLSVTGLAVTGIGVEVFRLILPMPGLAYPTYFVHMIFVIVVLIFMPFSKFAHIYYRFLALVHARMTGRDLETVSLAKPAEKPAATEAAEA